MPTTDTQSDGTHSERGKVKALAGLGYFNAKTGMIPPPLLTLMTFDSEIRPKHPTYLPL